MFWKKKLGIFPKKGKGKLSQELSKIIFSSSELRNFCLVSSCHIKT